MGSFISFDPRRASVLFIERNGFFFPSYYLTDGVNIYGELSYPRLGRKTANVETADQNWKIEPGKVFSREKLVKDIASGLTIATLKSTLWQGKVTLEFANGQTFSLIREGIFTGKLTWYSDQFGNFLSVKSKLFSFKKPFIVSIDANTSVSNANLLLMTFLIVYLVLARRARAAAH